MPRRSEYVTVPVSSSMTEIALWLAKRRIVYEYPMHDPQVFRDYGEDHVETITRSLIAELVVFDYLHTGLAEALKGMEPAQRNTMAMNRLSIGIIVGDYDSGHDLKVLGKTLDVKCYGTRQVSVEQISKLNLLINVNEVSGRQKSDLYAQVFFTHAKEAVIAGYHEGLPPRNNNFPSPAYACPVAELQPIEKLQRLVAGV